MKLSLLTREPLVPFVAVGLALFGLRAIGGSDGAPKEARERIEVGAPVVDWLSEGWRARWMRPPTEEELRGLVDQHVREEVLYRAALGLGLDRDDGVVRRRLVQKLELMADDLASQVAPAEAELRAHFEQHADRYRAPASRAFRQVFLDADRHPDGGQAAARALLERLEAEPALGQSPERLGDATLLEAGQRAQTEEQVAGRFGAAFAAALFELEPGVWAGPLSSAYGVHLVRVDEARAATPPDFDAVRDRVARDCAAAARERAREALVEGFAGRYEVRIDDAAIRAAALAVGGGGRAR